MIASTFRLSKNDIDLLASIIVHTGADRPDQAEHGVHLDQTSSNRFAFRQLNLCCVQRPQRIEEFRKRGDAVEFMNGNQFFAMHTFVMQYGFEILAGTVTKLLSKILKVHSVRMGHVDKCQVNLRWGLLQP